MIRGTTAWKYFERGSQIGELSGPCVQGVAGSPERHEYFVSQMKLGADGTVSSFGFRCPGCLAAIAVGGLLAELLVGKTPASALELTPEGLVENLGGLPLGRAHFIWLALQATQEAARAGLAGVP